MEREEKLCIWKGKFSAAASHFLAPNSGSGWAPSPVGRRLPALQRHRPITDLKLITRDGRTDVRTDPPSVLLGAVAVRGGRRESGKARREHFLRHFIPHNTVTPSGSLSEPLEVELP